MGRAAGRRETEKGCSSPSAGEHRDNEEHEDKVWGKLTLIIESVDEICLRGAVSDEQIAVAVFTLTSMPSTGISVTISHIRQKPKRRPPNILPVV